MMWQNLRLRARRLIESLYRRFNVPGGALGLIAGYFIVQWLVRIIIGGGLELDEAEQVIFAQRLQAGYSPDPPLYTWLQIPLFALFGEGVPALSLLKNLLLFTTCASSYFSARHCGLSPEHAGLAALNLILLPQIGWESQRDLTHSVLVTTMASLTLWAVLCLLRGAQGVGQYLLLGLLAGLGMLSKFNYGLLVLVVVIALGSLRPGLLFRPAMLAALLVGLAIVSPYLVWAADHLATATATSYKLKTGGEDYWGGVLQGLGSLAKAYLAFSGLFLVAFMAVFMPWRTAWPVVTSANREAHPIGLRFLKRLFLITPVVMVAYLLVSGGTVYRDRWLLPLLFFLPLLCFASVPEHWLDERHKTLFKKVLVVVMLILPAGLLARNYLYPLYGTVVKPHFPGVGLARELVARAGEFSIVIAESSFIGGNLKPYLGARLVDTPTVDFPIKAIVEGTDKPVLLIWNGGDYPDGPPDELVTHIRRAGLTVAPVGEPATLEKRYRFSDDQSFVLAWQFWK